MEPPSQEKLSVYFSVSCWQYVRPDFPWGSYGVFLNILILFVHPQKLEEDTVDRARVWSPFAEPYIYSFCCLIDLVHHFDPRSSLFVVKLIDEDRLDLE
jgi:hypothetical protein